MDKEELSDRLIGRTVKAREIYSPDSQNHLGRLWNYYNHLEKSPEKFKERIPFLEKFKDYLIKPYSEKIESFEQEMSDIRRGDSKQGVYLALKVKLGIIAAFISFLGAVTHNLAFLVFTAAGAGYAVSSVCSAAKMFGGSDEKIRDMGMEKFDLEKCRDRLETEIQPEDLEEVLKDNQDSIRPLLYSQ